MTRRQCGSGTIELEKSGRYRIRVTLASGRRASFGTCGTKSEAEAKLLAILARLNDTQPVFQSGTTLIDFGKKWMVQRESLGIRDIRTDKSRWKTHVESWACAHWPMTSLRSNHVRDWRDVMYRKLAKPAPHHKRKIKGKLATSTIKNTLNLLRCCLSAAVEAGLIKENPAQGVRAPRRAAEPSNKDKWTYLDADEQAVLLDAIPKPERWLVAVAIGTGLRQGEQWCLEKRDVHLEASRPYVYIRWGSPGLPPKNGKCRKIPLFGIALEAMKRWMAETKGWPNPMRLAFPTKSGCRRADEKPPRGWDKWLDQSGVSGVTGVKVTWHSLRHTCAASLVSGFWGRNWSLEEVREILGHSSIHVTERYAHLAPTVLSRAADAAQSMLNDAARLERPGAMPVAINAELAQDIDRNHAQTAVNVNERQMSEATSNGAVVATGSCVGPKTNRSPRKPALSPCSAQNHRATLGIRTPDLRFTKCLRMNARRCTSMHECVITLRSQPICNWAAMH